jgi:hypothetical protein
MTEADRPRRERDEHDLGAEGGDSESKDRPPAAPADDDAPLGDTDQHSDADA